MISIRVNDRQLQALNRRIIQFGRVTAIKIAGEITIRDIREKTARGVDADNRRFDPYSASHAARRKREGFDSSLKNLRMTGRLLDSLYIDGRTVTVLGDQQEKAAGQMENPRWRYHHKWLAAGDDTVNKIALALAKGIELL